MTARLGFVIRGSEPSSVKEKTKFYDQAAADSCVVAVVGFIFALLSGIHLAVHQKSFNLSQRTTLYPVLSGVAGGLLAALGWRRFNQARSQARVARLLIDQAEMKIKDDKNPDLTGPWKCTKIFISLIERNRGYLTSRLPAINRSSEEGELRKRLNELQTDAELLKTEIEKLLEAPIGNVDSTEESFQKKIRELCSSWKKDIPHYLRYQTNEALSRQVIEGE